MTSQISRMIYYTSGRQFFKIFFSLGMDFQLVMSRFVTQHHFSRVSIRSTWHTFRLFFIESKVFHANRKICRHAILHERSMTKTRLQKPAILSISLLIILMNAAIVPLLSQIRSAFPSASSLQVQMVLSLPALTSILFSLLTGLAVRWIPKKWLLAIGLLGYSIFGIATGGAGSMGELLLLRALFGAGTGIISPLASDLIADFYAGKERNAMIGYSNSTANIAGIIFPLLASLLAAIHWRLAFFIYTIGLLVLVFAILFIPKLTRFASNDHEKKKTRLQWSATRQAIIMLLFMLLFYALPTNLSVFVQTEGIGSPSTAALVVSTSTFIATLFSLWFSRLYLRFRDWLLPSSLALLGLSFLTIGILPNLTALLTAQLAAGIAMGLIFPYLTTKVIEHSQPETTTAGLALLSSMMGLGMFLSPFFFTFINSILPVVFIRTQFWLTAEILGLGAFILSIWLLGRKAATPRNMTIN
jgi:MFS family permease